MFVRDQPSTKYIRRRHVLGRYQVTQCDGLPHLVLLSVRGIVGGLLGKVLSWVLLRGFQQVHSRAIHPSAHLRNLRSVRNTKRECTQYCIALSLLALLKSLANWQNFVHLFLICQLES